MSLDQPPPASFDAMPWHQRSVVTALLVLFLGPIGAVFMWQFSRWSLSWKVLGTVYSVLYILVFLTAWRLVTVTPAAAPVVQSTPTPQSTTVVINIPTVAAVAPTSVPTLPPAPTAPPPTTEPTPPPIEPTAAPPTLVPITAIPIDRAAVPPTFEPLMEPTTAPPILVPNPEPPRAVPTTAAAPTAASPVAASRSPATVAPPPYEWVASDPMNLPARPRYQTDVVMAASYTDEQTVAVLADAARRTLREKADALAVVVFGHSSREQISEGADKGRALVSRDGLGWTGDKTFSTFLPPPAVDQGKIYISLGDDGSSAASVRVVDR